MEKLCCLAQPKIFSYRESKRVDFLAIEVIVQPSVHTFLLHYFPTFRAPCFTKLEISTHTLREKGTSNLYIHTQVHGTPTYIQESLLHEKDWRVTHHKEAMSDKIDFVYLFSNEKQYSRCINILPMTNAFTHISFLPIQLHFPITSLRYGKMLKIPDIWKVRSWFQIVN